MCREKLRVPGIRQTNQRSITAPSSHKSQMSSLKRLRLEVSWVVVSVLKESGRGMEQNQNLEL